MVMTNEHVTEFELIPFQKKAVDFIFNSTFFINIAEGAVRSSKTIVVIYRFILAVMQGKGTNYVIAGRTTKTCHVNVVLPLLRILKTLGIEFEYWRETEITIIFKNFTKKIYIFGANDVEAANKIAGLTLQAILIDEASRCNKGFFQMALTRLSEPGAKAFVTTNPDNSMHWLKTDYIDSQYLKEQGKIRVWTFYLDDNPSLTEEVVDNITETARSNPVLYARLIEAQWVSSTGLIYSNFSLEDNTFDTIDLNKYNKILIPICLGLFIILGLIVLITPADHNSVPESAPVKEQSINSAGDFKVPGSFRELNKEDSFAQYEDSFGQTITITKLDNQTDYVDTWFTNMSYTTHAEVIKPATETDITNLYSVDEISDLNWIRGYVELVEVNEEKYIIQVNEYENLYEKNVPLAFCYDLVEDIVLILFFLI